MPERKKPVNLKRLIQGREVVQMNEILKVILVGIFTTIIAAINKAGEC